MWGDFARIYARALEVHKEVTTGIGSSPDLAKVTMADIDDEIAASRRELKTPIQSQTLSIGKALQLIKRQRRRI